MIGMGENIRCFRLKIEEQYHAQMECWRSIREGIDYGAGIKAFMDQLIGCPIDEEYYESLLIQRGGKRYSHYAQCTEKANDVKEEELRHSTGSFLKELILLLGRWKMHVWMKNEK